MKTRTSLYLSAAIFLVLAVSVLGEAQDRSPIMIGVVMDQTGSAAYYSKESEKGVRLAVDEINARGGVGGRKLALIVEDDQNNPPLSAQKVRKLAADKNVVAILSISGSASAQQNQKVAEEEQIPEIVPTNISNALTERFLKYFFRLNVPDKHYVQVLMETAAKGFRKVALISDNTQTGLNSRDAWVEDLKKRDVGIVGVEQIDTGATDATPQVLKIKSAGPDLVLLSAQGVPELALLARTIRRMNWQVAVMGGLTLGVPAFLDLAREAANGILYTDVIDDNKPAMKEFTKNFMARHSDIKTITGNSTLSYDAVYLLAEAIKRRDASREGIRVGLETLTGYDRAVSGRVGSTVRFSPRDHQGLGPDAVVIRTFKDQKPATYTGS